MSLALKFAVPVVAGRGAGLGNELFSWAKAYIASQALGLRLLHPAWGMNVRPYRRYFGTSRIDWIFNRAISHVLPTFDFTETEYLKYAPASFYDAVQAFGRDNDIAERHTCVVEFSGMWGGLPLVIGARDFVLKSLLQARHSEDNLFQFRRRQDPTKFTVGVHIRRGDFHNPVQKQDYAAKINVSIPVDWFTNTCAELKANHGKDIQIAVFGDASDTELRPLMSIAGSDCILMRSSNADISDLLALASCDLIVCSLSSYSVWAAALSHGRYIWLRPHLTQIDDRLTIWGYENAAQLSYVRTRAHIENVKSAGDLGKFVGRGAAVDWDGIVPGEMHEHIRRSILLRREDLDLILYGSIPSAARAER